ncbi:putative metal-dependent phosphotriesterase family hydrolase [Kitasatospora sp. MAP12-15]|uniref:phosphotriesterase family protein n=1 Tax=unclassified Kitasatospora TaxID=2633591 RepID=UPI00247576EA|nr:phosphotriesterase [Kitasatospora sp. MAP12-44]MDH6114085.1 putative metal-dependent phosphotriesterase family hydrolase [Kitasatospora sp. MAP12-44]
MSGAVRTVLGDLDPAELGVCDAHDHLFLRSPQLPGQELDDPRAAAAELAEFHAAGGRAVVQWTPYGMARGADHLAELSRRSGIHLVAATGLHRAAHYDRLVPAELYDGLAELFTAELTAGIRGDGPRAGLIKVAGGYHGLDEHARIVMAAAAEAHHATGAPIGVHHELGTGALDVLELLCGRLGVPPQSVVLGHLNRFPDPRVHRELAEAGAYLAFDGPSTANHATDWRLLDVMIALVEAGHGDRLLLGGDTTTAAARHASGGGPGMPFLLTGLRPRIIRELGAEQAELIFRGNPARAFAAHWGPSR